MKYYLILSAICLAIAFGAETAEAEVKAEEVTLEDTDTPKPLGDDAHKKYKKEYKSIVDQDMVDVVNYMASDDEKSEEIDDDLKSVEKAYKDAENGPDITSEKEMNEDLK